MKDFLGNTVEVGDYMLDAYNCWNISKLRVIQVEHCLSDMYPDRPDLSDFVKLLHQKVGANLIIHIMVPDYPKKTHYFIYYKGIQND